MTEPRLNEGSDIISPFLNVMLLIQLRAFGSSGRTHCLCSASSLKLDLSVLTLEAVRDDVIWSPTLAPELL